MPRTHQHKRKKKASVSHEQDDVLKSKSASSTDTIDPIMFAGGGQMTPDSIMQLQNTVGNQATLQLMRQNMSGGGDAVIQRWPEWLDKALGKSKSEENEPLLGEQQDNSGKSQQVIDLELFRDTLQSWANKWAIHKNYKKYAHLVGNAAWKTAMKIWEYINKIVDALSNIDPSGITKLIAKVSAFVRTLAEYVTEAYDLISDDNLVVELTPLLDQDPVEMVKGSIKEVFDVWKSGKSAWDAVMDVV